jgi:hypothetical protein
MISWPMRLLTISVSVLTACLLCGCKAGSPFVGKWNSQSDLMGLPMTSVTENNADGTFKTVSTVRQGGSGAALIVTDTGTWKLDGDKLTIVVKDIDWEVGGASADKAKRATDMFTSNKAQMIQQANADPAKTLAWKGNDEFSFAQNGKTFTYRRAK